MISLSRRNKELQEPIEQLEARYAEAGKSVQAAYDILTPDEFRFIAKEIRNILRDPVYYLQNYHFIRTKDLIIKTLYPLFDSQELFLEKFMRQFEADGPIRLIALKCRQAGLTTLGVALECWLAFLHPYCHVLEMSDEMDKVIINFDMCRVAWKFLPWWIQPDKRYDQRPVVLGFDRLKPGEDQSPGLESLMYFESAQQPSGAAYSKSIYGAHLAEIGRYRDPKPITEGVFGSLVRYRHSIGIMEGTAQGRNTTFHKLWLKAEAGKFWEPVFMEWFREPGYYISVPSNYELTVEESAIKKKVKEECNYDLSDGQIAWRREKKEEFEAAGDEDKFEQEFPINPEEAFVSRGLTAFPKRCLKEMSLNFGRSPRWMGEIKLLKDNKTPKLSRYNQGSLWIWEVPQKNAIYQIGADCAMGIEGADYSCAEIYCVPSDINQPIRQVARWRGYMSPTEYARVLGALGYLYNTAEIAPECNKIDSVASDLHNALMYPKIYRWMREDKIKANLSYFIGWLTTHKNKKSLIGRMRDALLAYTIIIRCEKDIDEMYNFVELEPGSGTYGAIDGHDDTVMANLITYYTATQLRPRYAQDEEEQEKRNPNANFHNTDFSPYWDKIENDFETDPRSGPSFMEL